MATQANTPTKTVKVRTAGDTSKAKPQIAADLGMTLANLEQMSICWVPVPLDETTKRLISDVAEVRKSKAHAVLSKLATEAIEAGRKAMEKETEAIVRALVDEMSEEELQKAEKALQAKMDKLKAAMKLKAEAAKAAAAAAAATAKASGK